MSASAADKGSSKPRMSPWFPISLLALTTVALAVPFVLLRRKQRSSATPLGRAIDSASAPPPRRSTARAPLPTTSAAEHTTASRSTLSPPRRVAQTTPEPTLSKTPPAPAATRTSQASPTNEHFFDAPLYTLKAFGIATTLVVGSGVTSVWGVKTYLGVRDTQEFATTMRQTLLEKMPFLASRIHRPPSSDPLPPPSPFSSPEPDSPSPSLSENSSSKPPASSGSELESWTWSAAQVRLSKAYDEGGLGGWLQAAAIEVEMEAEIERRRKGLWVDEKTKISGSGAA